MVSGSGTIGLFKRTLALSGKTRAMATAPAASLGTGKTPACPTRYGPDQVFQILGFFEGPTPTSNSNTATEPQSNGDRHADTDSDFMLPVPRLRRRNSAGASSRLDCRERNQPRWRVVANVQFRVAIAAS